MLRTHIGGLFAHLTAILMARANKGSHKIGPGQRTNGIAGGSASHAGKPEKYYRLQLNASKTAKV